MLFIDLNFGKYRFWRWILYGTCQTLALQVICFHALEGPSALYDTHGQPSCLWVTGTHIYGMVVIMTNIKVWNSTSNHSIFSDFIVFGSIASFYLMVYIENTLPFIPQLYGLFKYAMRQP
jgi:magnesium-transporting ATPase (P-type)